MTRCSAKGAQREGYSTPYQRKDMVIKKYASKIDYAQVLVTRTMKTGVLDIAAGTVIKPGSVYVMQYFKFIRCTVDFSNV